MNEEKLKPCPICNGKAKYSNDVDDHFVAWVECSECGVKALGSYKSDLAVRQWNDQWKLAQKTKNEKS